ncbi:MAG: hypothetical protein CND29_00840 [Marine Group II euryarchaeote MED-G36]|nr:MAG: hypothetical protein CND29_00840 [Marine Group II euryarchaeote MED-G36]
MAWQQPPENSVAALEHGMLFSDGVEFDLKMSRDGDLVIFHDDLLPNGKSKRDRCIELLGTDELKSIGIPTFDELLASRKFTDSWQEGGKTACIEFKMPHPVSKKKHESYIAKMMELIENKLEPLELPERSTVIYSFSPKIASVAKSNEFKFPITRLMPHLRPWGVWRIKRMMGMPHFARTTVSSMIRHSRKNEMPAIGLALEFLNGWTRWISPGIPLGLKGAALSRLNKKRAGMGAFVWPAPLELEDLMLDAGLSLVTDHMNPDVLTKPDGSIRWMRPASQPLDDEWRRILDSATDSERPDLFKEASHSLPKWSEIDDLRRNSIVIEQGNRMHWSGSEESWVKQAERGVPWGSPRIIGHRGAGKTHSK